MGWARALDQIIAGDLVVNYFRHTQCTMCDVSRGPGLMAAAVQGRGQGTKREHLGPYVRPHTDSRP